MKTISAGNVNDAWAQALAFMEEVGEIEPSRIGNVKVAPFPVATVYYNPKERVLFDPVRDANPFFHLHEALWMLAGEADATYLNQFVGDFSLRFAEEDGIMHGAYGYRWRRHFEKVNSYRGGNLDQLDVVVRLLQKNHGDRQAVIQMWDAESDLDVPGLKDRPCNTQIYLRIRDGVLDLCTMVRSNDIVWGCYGANAVHFTVLQEYLAARIGVGIGRFTQFSWNWHMYDTTKHLASIESARRVFPYPGTIPLVTDPDTFDAEVRRYIVNPDSALTAKNTFLESTARALFKANEARKAGDYKGALEWAGAVLAPDWRKAAVEWLERRQK